MNEEYKFMKQPLNRVRVEVREREGIEERRGTKKGVVPRNSYTNKTNSRFFESDDNAQIESFVF